MNLLYLTACLVLAVGSTDSNNETITRRHGRIFPFIIFPLYPPRTVAPVSCVTATGFDGTCYTNARCLALGLTPSGPCTAPSGVCCIAIKTCGGVSAAPVTYFNSPPIVPPRCTLTITKANATITQLRLDFIQFSLRQPTLGRCTNFLMLSPTDTTLPRLCGENSGSHVYIDFDPLCANHTLQFTFSDLSSVDQWNIRITQIPFTSDLRAPYGCLQYYGNSITGTISSFNFGSTRVNDTNQLSPLNYGICIRPQTGFCQIKYSLGEFFVSNDLVCNRNYVVIPGSSPETAAATPTLSDRYCDSDFPNPNTTSKPYVFYVITNVDETDVGATGFRLTFQQQAC